MLSSNYADEKDSKKSKEGTVDEKKKNIQVIDGAMNCTYDIFAASEQDFASKTGSERTPLGAMASRTLKDVNAAKTLPGMRDGQYTIVRYDSSFAHKATAVESVTLESEHGAWSVVSYSVN